MRGESFANNPSTLFKVRRDFSLKAGFLNRIIPRHWKWGMIRYDPLLGILHIRLQATFKPFVDLGVIPEKPFL